MRIRSIKPQFFRHEKLQELEVEYPHAKIMLFFCGLWGLCDNRGRFEWKPKQIKLDILPFVPYNPEETLCILVQNNFIEKYEVDGFFYGHIFNLKKHQRFTGKEAANGEKFPAPMQENIVKLPSCETTGKQRGNNGETILPKNQTIENQPVFRGNNGETTGKHLGTQEKEKEKEKEKEEPENIFSDFLGKVGIQKKSDFGGIKKVGKKKINPAVGVEPFQEVYVSIFSEAWLERRKTKYKWEPKDFAAIKKISKFLRADKPKWEKQDAEKEFQELILKSYNDSFISKNNFENFVPTMILYRINSIYSANQNQKQIPIKKKNPDAGGFHTGIKGSDIYNEMK